MTIETKRTKMMNCQKQDDKNLHEKTGQQKSNAYMQINERELRTQKYS